MSKLILSALPTMPALIAVEGTGIEVGKWICGEITHFFGHFVSSFAHFCVFSHLKKSVLIRNNLRNLCSFF